MVLRRRDTAEGGEKMSGTVKQLLSESSEDAVISLK